MTKILPGRPGMTTRRALSLALVALNLAIEETGPNCDDWRAARDEIRRLRDDAPALQVRARMSVAELRHVEELAGYVGLEPPAFVVWLLGTVLRLVDGRT